MKPRTHPYPSVTKQKQKIIAGSVTRNISNLRYADDTTLMAEREEQLKSLDESEKREWKSWLKAQHSVN